MQRAILNLIALYKEDPTLFDDFALPENLDKNNLLGRLIIECGELEVYLTRPDTMKTAIGFWSGSRVASWSKLADMVTYEYNPIWNVDGVTYHEGSSESLGVNTGNTSENTTENISVDRELARTSSDNNTINRNKSFDRDRDETNTTTNTHTDTRTDNLTETKSGSDDTTTTNTIAADNVEGFSNDTKSVINEDISETVKNTGTQQNTGNFTNNVTIGETIEDTETERVTEQGTGNINDTEEETTAKTGTKTGTISGRDEKTGSEEWHERRTGNIGVTMTQQLLEAEKALWSEYDVEGQIITEFKQEFLIMVY